MVYFRSIGESEFENMHLARLWREGSPERQLVALSAELRRSGLLLKNTIDSPSPSKRITKKYTFCVRFIFQSDVFHGILWLPLYSLTQCIEFFVEKE